MTEDETREVKNGLSAKRDELQKTMSEARGTRVELTLANMDKHRDFLQKIGELSFILGAAIIPVIIASRTDEKIQYLSYVIAGVTLYLVNGMVALWRCKQIIERNADDPPYVGLEEEIYTYPVVHAHNKLLLELDNETYQEEYSKSSLAFLDWAHAPSTQPKKPKVTFWLDGLLIGFVVASLLVVRAVWPYSTLLYWCAFGVIAAFMIALTVVSYIKSWKSQVLLQAKRDKLADIKREYQSWHNKNVFKK